MKEGEFCQGFKAKELQRRLYLPFTTMLFAGELFVNRPEARNWLIFDHMAATAGFENKMREKWSISCALRTLNQHHYYEKCRCNNGKFINLVSTARLSYHR